MTHASVLVVDDHPNEAEVFADLIRTRTGLEVAVTSSPVEAISIAEQNPLRVLVLDEVMPTPGTELFVELMRVVPDARAIMLTQEHDFEASQRAINLGFRFHLHKSQITQLPDTVMRFYIEAVGDDSSGSRLARPTPVFRRRRFLAPDVVVNLLAIEELDSRYVDEDSWLDYVTVNAGERITATTQITKSTSLRVDRNLNAGLHGQVKLPLPIPKLEAGLRVALGATRATSQSRSVETVDRLERTYELPKEPTDRNQVHVKTRQLLYSHVYRRLRVLLESHCAACTLSSTFVSIVLEPSNLVALRQIDYLSDGSKDAIDTGFKLVE